MMQMQLEWMSLIINSLESRVENNNSFWDFKDNYKKEHIPNILI